MQLTNDALQEVNVKLSLRQNVVDACNTMFDQFAVNTFLRIAHFMAQVCHESNGFRVTVENLNYTNPHRLMLIWPKRFNAISIANQFINSPEKLGNFVYANRMGNGNAASGDGFRYRGRGPMQTTGKASYREISSIMFNDDRLIRKPNLLTDINNGLRAAFIEWTEGNCNKMADADDIKSVTKFINGGLTGLDSRREWLADWKHALRNNI